MSKIKIFTDFIIIQISLLFALSIRLGIEIYDTGNLLVDVLHRYGYNFLFSSLIISPLIIILFYKSNIYKRKTKSYYLNDCN